MLSTEASDLYEEIRNAEEARDTYLSDFDTQLSRWHGSGYHGRGSNAVEEQSLEPFAHEFVSLILPTLIPERMRINLKTALGPLQAEIVLGAKHSANRWIRMVDLRHTASLVALDMSFNFGVFLTVMEERELYDLDDDAGGWEGASRGDDVRAWPNVYRVPQRWYFQDPNATDWKSCRFRGHKAPIDLEDLQEIAREADEEDGWLSEEIMGLKAGAGVDGLKRDDNTPDRGEVVVYEVWIPEIQQDGFDRRGGYHGTIVTLAYSDAGDDDSKGFVKIREDRPYWGPRSGPYAFAGSLPVVDSDLPLSPLQAIDRQMDEMNIHAEAMSRNAREYKRLVICSSDNPDLAERMRTVGDSFVIDVPGFDKDHVVVVELGGVSDTQILHAQINRERVERLTGISEAQAGRPNPDTTATADTIALNASQRRMGWIRGQFNEALRQAIRTALWIMLHDDRFVMALGSEAYADLRDNNPSLPEQSPEVLEFRGGDLDESNIAIDDLIDDIEIESLDERDRQEQMARIAQAFTLFQGLVQASIQLPVAQWKAIGNRMADAFGIPEFATAIDYETARKLGEQMIGASGQFPTIGSGDSMSKVGVTVGPKVQDATGSGDARATGQGKLGGFMDGQQGSQRAPAQSAAVA